MDGMSVLVAVLEKNTRSVSEWGARVNACIVREVCSEGEFKRAVTLRLSSVIVLLTYDPVI